MLADVASQVIGGGPTPLDVGPDVAEVGPDLTEVGAELTEVGAETSEFGANRSADGDQTRERGATSILLDDAPKCGRFFSGIFTSECASSAARLELDAAEQKYSAPGFANG